MTAQEALRTAMTAEALTTEDVASKAGLSHKTVTNTIAGRTSPSRLTLNALRKIPGFAKRYVVNVAA